MQKWTMNFERNTMPINPRAVNSWLAIPKNALQFLNLCSIQENINNDYVIEIYGWEIACFDVSHEKRIIFCFGQRKFVSIQFQTEFVPNLCAEWIWNYI